MYQNQANNNPYGQAPPQQGYSQPPIGYQPAPQPTYQPPSPVIVTVGNGGGAGAFCPRCNTTTPDAVFEEISILGWVLCVLFFPIGLLCLLCCKNIVGKCTICGTTKWSRSG